MRNIQKFMVILLAMVLATFGAACERSETGVEAAREDGATEGILMPAEREFIVQLEQWHVMERDLARLAQQKAQNEDVKEYAETLESDHGDALRSLVELSQEEGMQQRVEQKSAANKEHLNQLQNLSGSEFDRKFMDLMVQNHEKSVQKLESQLNTANNLELREYVEDLLPTIREHLEQAREIQSELTTGTR